MRAVILRAINEGVKHIFYGLELMGNKSFCKKLHLLAADHAPELVPFSHTETDSHSFFLNIFYTPILSLLQNIQ